MNKLARATAQAQKAPEGLPFPGRASLRTYAGGTLPHNDEHSTEHRDKPSSLRDLQRWPELSNIPSLTQHTAIRSTQQNTDTTTTPLLKPLIGQNLSTHKASIGHDFSQIRVHPTPAPTLQAKLAVNQPGDQYEQEAEQVADHVLRMVTPGTSIAPASPNDDKPEDGTILRKQSNAANTLAIPGAPPIVSEVLRGGRGQPLDSTTRSFMEQRLGHDFSRVRIHTDEQAGKSAQSVHALAYTVGCDVVFERGQYAPETEAGRRLLAHELTHVVQQRGAPALPALSATHTATMLTQPSWQTAPGERVTIHEQTDGQRVQREDQPAQQEKSWWDDLTDFAGDAIWTIIKEFAPELEPILREILDKGILEWLKGKLSSVIDTFINTLMEPVHTVQGAAQWLSTHFSELLTWMQEATAKLAKGDCSAIIEAGEKIQQVVSGIVTPIVDRVKELANKVGNFFTGLWDSFGAPIWDWLKKAGGAVWEKIQQLGSWIWEKTEPIRNKITKAWTWLKNKLGIGEGPEGQNGLLQWVQNKVSEAWEWIKQKIEPIKKPLMIVAGIAGGIVVMLSPAGPFVAAGAAIAGLIAGIRWLRQHFTTPDGVVSNRDVLQKVIIPGIINAIHSFTGKLASAAGAITDKLNGIMAGLGQVIGSLSGSILNFAIKAVQWIADQFQNLVNWASDKLMALVDWVSRGLKHLLDFLQPVFDVLKQIGEVILDILKLPFLIAGKLWHMIPACIRDPFVNFLIEHILKHIPLFNKIMAVPNIWQKIQARAMEIIHKIFKDGDLTGAIILVFKTILDVFGIPLELVTGIFEKAANALDQIVQDPLGFLKNVLGALKEGFFNFFKNIATHLLAGVADWLFGELLEKGIHRPEDLSFMSIFKFVMEILDLSVETIFRKLEEKIGPEKVKMLRSATRAIGKAWDWITDLLKDGPAGLWKRLTEKLSDLWHIFLDGIIGWVSKNIITAMSEQLLSFLDPTGIMEIIQGIIDIYRMIKSAFKYMEKMLRIINTILDTIVGIAGGMLGPAAKMLEDAMDAALPVVLGFLAGEVGLDNIGESLKDMVELVREKVDEAIDWLIDTALEAGRAVLDALGLGEKQEEKPAENDTAEAAAVKAKALEEVNTELQGKKLPSLDAFHEMLLQVLEKYRPEGLKSLSANVVNEELMAVEVSASASEPKTIGLKWDDVFDSEVDLDDEEKETLRELLSTQGRRTYAAISVDKKFIGYEENDPGADHAEEVLLKSASWTSALQQANVKAENDGTTEVVITLNRAPCPSCTKLLISALSDAKAKYPKLAQNGHFTLAPTGVYEPTKEVPDKELEESAKPIQKNLKVATKGALKKEKKELTMRTDKYGRTRSVDLEYLEAGGWDLQVLIAKESMSAYGKVLATGIQNIEKLERDLRKIAAEDFNKTNK